MNANVQNWALKTVIYFKNMLTRVLVNAYITTIENEMALTVTLRDHFTIHVICS